MIEPEDLENLEDLEDEDERDPIDYDYDEALDFQLEDYDEWFPEIDRPEY